MKEYFSESAAIFQQTTGKLSLLLPAINRHLPEKGGLLLDVGCGSGDLFYLAQNNNYEYFGLDVSPDMIDLAKSKYPKGSYLISDSTTFSKDYDIKFDVIIMNMLFPAFSKRESIEQTINEARKVINYNGTLIIGLPHPCFDQYMQAGLLGKKGVETDFQGYFKNGNKFLIYKEMESGTMIYEDYHWTMEDYFPSITRSGFVLTEIDECPPTQIDSVDDSYIQKKNRFPTYILLIAKPN